MDEYKQELLKERTELLETINNATDRPIFILSFIWLGLVILELTVGASRPLEYASFVIWVMFIADYLLELLIAPSSKDYLKTNWLGGLALLLPAFRILRIFQSLKVLKIARALRSLNLLKIIASLNRSILTLRSVAADYGIRYIFPLTGMIFFAGAAGIFFFENPHNTQLPDGITTYGDALWWTAMLMTTFGSDYWPQTLEGRLLTIVLAGYSIAIFGYITATLASLLVEKRKRKV
jgi:voltage-gated potassium channel